MNKIIPTIVIAILLVLTGCKSKDAAQNTEENNIRLDKLAGDVDSASKTLNTLKDDFASRMSKVETEISAIKRMLEKFSGVKAGSTETESADSADLAEDIDTLSTSISAVSDSLASFAAELTSLRSDVQNLATANREVSDRNQRRQNWEDMGDPKKLATKLDDFTKKYSEKLLATGRSGEFEADMVALRDSVSKEYNTAELTQKYKADLEKRIAETTDERMKGFLQNQLSNLQTAQGDQLTEQLQNYQRFSSMQQISAIAEKYQIPRDELNNAGIMAFGGRGGFGGPGGGPGGRNRGNRGGGGN